MCSYYNSSFLKKDRNYRNNTDIRLHDDSRHSFRNLKDANSCMFSWFITTSSLLICSWHYATPSQFVQEMYSIYSKSLLFTSTSCVQESFKLNKIITDKSIFLYWWFSFDLYYCLILGSTSNALHSSVKINFVHSLETGTSEKVLQ